MGKKDTVTKDYMRDTKVFADAFNYLIYGGEQIIDSTKLHELDTTTISVPYGADGAGIPVQKYRDMLKYLTAMEDEQAAYVILGAELQSEIHYAAPVKEMLYDALQYSKQVDEAAKFHREAGKIQKINNVTVGEFLSGFHREDRLLPVVTLMIYFGPDAWDAPVTLHEMFSVQNDKILNYVSDYRINLISPAAMSEEEIDKFQTSLREVMLYIKYSKDKEKLQSILKRDEKFKCMERKTIEVINAATNSRLKVPEKKGSADVCQAIDDMCRDAKEDGLKQNTINLLNRKLMEDNRMDDFKRSLTDAKFQRELLEEYKIS